MPFSRNQQEDDDLNSMQDYLKKTRKHFFLSFQEGLTHKQHHANYLIWMMYYERSRLFYIDEMRTEK